MSKPEAKETLEIPAKPAAITAANAAALTGMAVAATGPVGAAVAAAVAVSAIAATKTAKSKRAAKASMRTSTGGASRGRTSSGRSSSTPRASRVGGLLGKLTGGRRATGTTGKAAASRTGTGSKTGATGKTGTGRTTPSTLSRMARAMKPSGRSGSAPTGAASTSRPKGIVRRSASGVGGAATKAAKWAFPKAGRAIKSAVTAGASNQKGKGSTSPRWARARKFFQEKILGRKKKELGKKPEENVATTVARRNRPEGSTETVTIKGRVVVRRSGKPVPLGAPSIAHATGGNSMRNHAAQMFVSAGEFTPRGLLDITNEIYDLQDVAAYVAGAVGTIVQKAKKGWPLHDDVVAKIGQMVEDLYAAAEKAKQLPQMVEDCHKEDLARFRNPRAGEEMADYAVNNVGRG